MFEKYIQSGVINAEDLHALLNDEDHQSVQIIDATFVLPISGHDPESFFKNNHIEGAQFFDIKANANPDSHIPNTLPTPPDFARKINQMGISNDDFIVIYGQQDMVMGPARLWWMFRIFGHDRVCILNGGLPAWQAAGFKTTDAGSETPTHSPNFTTNFQEKLLTNIDHIKTLCDAPNAHTKIIDARSPERFSGKSPEPREGMRSGHIPGSINIPAKSLVTADTGVLKSKEELNQIFKKNGLLEGKQIISTCGSGITACMIALALFHVGRTDVSVYDGSWCEWGYDSAGTPIAN